MTILITVVTILQTISVSLGVGSSTLAIVNFFVAIADGKIDETERRMMGVVYKVLRVAMVLILVTTVVLTALEGSVSGLEHLSGFTWSELFVILILFINSMLMTAHLMPSTFGPALQAGSWYALGTLAGIEILGQTGFTFGEFLMSYITWLILAVGIVNGIMASLKPKKKV
ncbi:hypothetical protein H6785_03400 [Candidatus Nomurabacteria bacterium]|nr:hypothetical protein [Candidatus Nomurabacteria bacterium]